MKSIVSIIGVLSLTLSISVALTSQPASAAVTWPQEFSDTGITQVVAHGDDKLTLLSCDFTSIPSTNSFTIITNGLETGSYPQNGSFSCDPRESDITGPDGTVYGTHTDNSGATPVVYLVAARNGGFTWTANLNFDSGCAGVAGVGRAPTSMSIGADGNLYFIEADGQYNPFCNQYLVGVDTHSGSIIERVNLGKYANNVGVKPAVWTYSDKIVAVDTIGKIHQYSYGPNYVEAAGTNSSYQFPGTPASGSVLANAAGDVYLIGDCGGSIYSHTHAGMSSNIPRTDSCYGEQQTFTLGPNGDVVGYYDGGSVYNYHMTSSPATYTVKTPAIPNGYAKAQTYYTTPYLVEDGQGNIVEMLQMTQNSSGYPAVGIAYIDASTGNTTSLYIRTGDGTSTGNAIAGRPDTYGGYMYLPVAHGSVGGGSTNTLSYVEKVSLGSFGSPVQSVHGFTAPHNYYVAMGDSFSSGEGNSPYSPESDTTLNTCHRSYSAYGALLPSKVSGISPPNFVACSGAVTSDLYSPNHTPNLLPGLGTGYRHEPAQMDALSDQTKLVTLTVGGNDLGFAEIMAACINNSGSSDPHCQRGGPNAVSAVKSMPARLAALSSPSSQASSTTGADGTPIYGWQKIIRDIHAKAPNAEIAILGYPELVSTSAFELHNTAIGRSTFEPGENVCVIGRDFPSGQRATGPVPSSLGVPLYIFKDEANWLSAQIKTVNDAIGSAVAAAGVSQAKFVPVDAAFRGHALCDADPWLYQVSASGGFSRDLTFTWSGSLHPNQDGQVSGYLASLVAALPTKF